MQYNYYYFKAQIVARNDRKLHKKISEIMT